MLPNSTWPEYRYLPVLIEMNSNVPVITRRPANLILESAPLPDYKRRRRLTASVTLLGCMIGAAAVLVSIMGQTSQYDEASHMPALPTAFFMAAGSLAALIITPFAIYHVRDNADHAANPLIWIGLGIGFGITWAFLEGALTPLTLTLLSYAENQAAQSTLASQIIDSILGGIRSFFVQGALMIVTGLLFGVIFCLGGFAIDVLNARQTVRLSSIGPWAVSIGLGTAILAFSLFGPPEFLRTLR